MSTLLRNHIGDAVVALDPELLVVYANQEAADFFGCKSTAELLGSKLTERISTGPQQLFSAILNGRDRIVAAQPVMFRHEDGCMVLADLTCSEIEHENLRLFVVTLHDYALACVISAESQAFDERFFRASSPIALADDDGKIVVANSTFKTVFPQYEQQENIEAVFTKLGPDWPEKLVADGTLRIQEEVGQATYLVQLERIENSRILVVCTCIYPADEAPNASMAEGHKGVGKDEAKPEDLGTVALISDSIMLKNFIENQLRDEGIRFSTFSSSQYAEIPKDSRYIIYAQPLIDEQEIRDVWHLIDEYPSSRLLVISFTFEGGRDLEVIQSGARGLINTEEHFSHLITALYAIHNGEYWCPRSILARFLRLNRNAFNMGRPGAKQHFGLTRREIEVIKLIAQNKSNKDIAKTLGVAYTTIVTHVYNIFRKLDVHSRYEAIQVSIRNGIV